MIQNLLMGFMVICPYGREAMLLVEFWDVNEVACMIYMME
jgi:hypothetical protein